MTFKVGAFEVFGAVAPGLMYLMVLLYAIQRLAWFDVATFLHDNSAIFVLGSVATSYVLGMITQEIGRSIYHWYAKRYSRLDDSTEYFLRQNPHAIGRVFVQQDPFVLLAKIELVDSEVAADITRLRAGGVMLRGFVAPSLLALLVAAVECFMTRQYIATSSTALLMFVIAWLALRRADEMLRWARQKTLQTAFWIPGIDDPFRPAPSPSSGP